jgi:hypothetical protein
MIQAYTYLIKFLPTGQLYYGLRTKNVKLNRLPEDDLMLHYKTSSKHIQALIKEHGIESFEWEIRRKFEDTQKAVKWEPKVLRRCKVLHNDKWFNMNIAGHILHTPESNKKISEFHKGKPHSAEHSKKISDSLKGRKKKPLSAEQKKKISEKLKGAGNPNYGKDVAESTRLKISIANKGKVRSDEVKKAMSKRISGDNNPGKNKSEATRLKLSLAQKGKKRKPHSAETIAKMSKPREKIICEHCGLEGGISQMKRWHGDNCKQRSIK